MLVRLIDVVLILLFGFISISTIERRTSVHLPDSESSAAAQAARGDIASVTVLHEPTATEGAAIDYLVGLARGVEQRVRGRDALAAELIRLQQKSLELAQREGREPVDLRVDLRIDREDRFGSSFDAYEVARDLGLVTRVVVRVPSAGLDDAAIIESGRDQEIEEVGP
jgi:hypothetical protein